jgi:HEAT repeat protein
MSSEIDWESLAAGLGLLRENGESSGTEQARLALEIIVGEDALRASVDYILAGRRGSGLAQSVLEQIHPWSAMSYCYEIFKTHEDIETRRIAVALLKHGADRRALPWISEFLEDEDAQIQVWGVSVLDQMLFSYLIEPEEAEDLLRKAEQHENEAVRERADDIRGYLCRREEAGKLL